MYCYYIPDDAEEEEANFIATFLSNDDNGVANNNTLDNTQEVIVFRDIFMECVFQNHDYEHLSESGSTIKANRYTCIENMTFPTGSLAMETQTIPKVAIQADETLVTLEWEFCRSQVRVNNTFTVAPFPPVTIPAIPPTLGLVPVGLPSPSAVSPTLAPNQLPSLFSQVPLGGPAVNVIRDPPTDDGGDKILIAAVVSGVTLVGLIFGIAIFFIFFRNGKGKKIQTVDPFGNESDSGFPVVTTNESLAGSTPANNMAPGEDETPIRAIHETSEQRPRSARAIQFKDQVQDYDPSSGNSSPSHIPTVAFREDTVFTNSTTAVSRRVLDP